MRHTKLLHSKGMLAFLEEPERREEVGLFFVRKKGDQLWMIADARRRTTTTPGAASVTAECLARAEVELNGDNRPEEAEGFAPGTSDISDAPHWVRIDRELSGYFCPRTRSLARWARLVPSWAVAGWTPMPGWRRRALLCPWVSPGRCSSARRRARAR